MKYVVRYILDDYEHIVEMFTDQFTVNNYIENTLLRDNNIDIIDNIKLYEAKEILIT